jgi:iron(III) transport system substrate-binding protein
MPKWAVYKDTLYATSLEPIGMVYNTKALKESAVPKTRAELIAFLKKPEVKGKVATFDPEKSGTGFLFHTNDVRTTDNFWDIAKAFGQANGKTYSSTGAMKETVVSGENVLAFNVIGSYAMDWAKEDNNLGAAFFTDNNAAFSRLIAIAKGAPHPNAAKLFLDFSLSKEGQSALASKGLPSVRTDVETGLNARTLEEKVGGKVTPIAVDEGLVEYMDPQKRLGFFREWKSAISQ